jgi:DNA-binding IclR family transcriptional regulator
MECPGDEAGDFGLIVGEVGQPGPPRIRAYCAALGHAQLAFLSEARQIAILESTELVKLSERHLDTLLDRLREVRARG